MLVRQSLFIIGSKIQTRTRNRHTANNTNQVKVGHTYQSTYLVIRSCRAKLSQAEHTLSLTKDELTRTKHALSTKEKNFVQEGKKRDRDMDKLRDQLTMALKDSVIARFEIKDKISIPNEGIRTHNDRLDKLASENDQLRQLLVQVRKSLVVVSQEAGVDIPDERALLTEPVEWNTTLFREGSEQILASLSSLLRKCDKQLLNAENSSLIWMQRGRLRD